MSETPKLVSQPQLKKLLEEGLVKFTFLKVKNDAERIAYGTLNLDYIPKEKHPKTSRNNQYGYFDVEVGAWRSYSPKSQFLVNKCIEVPKKSVAS